MTTQPVSKGFVILMGVLALALMLPIMVQETSMISNWMDSGFVLCSINTLPDSSVRFYEVDPLDFPEPPRPEYRDTLVTLNDTAATEARWVALLEGPHKPGRDVRLTFRHKGELQNTVIHTRPV